jgi:hypothetical protein
MYYAVKFFLPLCILAHLHTRIRIRRIKDPEDRTSLGESVEFFNSNNEFDLTCLSVAKPGESYRASLLIFRHHYCTELPMCQVVDEGSVIACRTFTPSEVADLLHDSDWIDVIGKEFM